MVQVPFWAFSILPVLERIILAFDNPDLDSEKNFKLNILHIMPSKIVLGDRWYLIHTHQFLKL